MKKQLVTFLVAMTVTTLSLAQAPNGFKYQAVVRNAGNAILTNQAVGIRMTIQQGSIGGTTVYSESFSEITNAFGLVNLDIGSGTVISGTFSAIDWGNGPYFIETAIDINGGNAYVVMGTSQLMSVPYALYAKTANSVENDNVNDADADPSNELQVLSLSNDTLYLSNGGFVQLNEYAIDNVDDADADPNNEIQILSFSNDTLYLSNGGSVYLGDYAIDLVDDADADTNNEIQDISLVGYDLSISSGSTVNLSGINTDQQTLNYNSGTSTLSILGGNSVVIPNGDITDVTAGNGLSGGGASGAITLTAVANNGLNVDATADAIQLGGPLTKNTTLTFGAFGLTYDLTGTGDFIIHDNTVPHFEVRDNGQTYFGGTTTWSALNTSGTTIATLLEDTDDGRFILNENGAASVDLDANTQFIFNEQGLDRDFRIESTLNQNAFFLDAGLDRVGLGTSTPQAKLQVTGGAIMPSIGLGAANGIMFPANAYGGSGDQAFIQYYAQSGEQTSLRIGNDNDWDDNVAFYQYGAQRMTIHDGNVGIGTVTPVFQLEIGTNSAAKPTSNTWTVTSDRRLKTDIKPYTNGLSDLMKIKPVWFTYNGQANMPKETGVGVIAQELQEVAPYMIKPWTYRDAKGTETEYLGVDNGAMTYMLINSVQEQQKLIETQSAENKELKAMILELQQRLEKLEKSE